MDSQPLGRFARMIAVTDRRYPLNAVVALHLVPFPPQEDIRNALVVLQRKHPALRARISGEAELAFVFDVTEPLPFDERVTLAPQDWIPVVEDYLNSRIDSAAGPLARFRALRTEDGQHGTLVGAFHHTIVDGASLQALLYDFLMLISGSQREGEQAGRMPDIEARFPPSFRGLRRGISLLGYTVRQLGEEVRLRMRRGEAGAFPVQAETHCRVIPKTLGTKETENLVRESRRQGVTLNSALGAALAMALCRTHAGGTDLPVQALTFAGLRPYLDPPLEADVLGGAIAMLRVTAWCRQKDSLWEFARRLQAAYSEAFQRGDKFSAFLLGDRVIRLMLRIHRFRVGDSAMSYTGPLELPLEFGQYNLAGFNAFISNNGVGPILSAQARLFRGQLWVDGLYMDGDMDSKQAQSLFDMVRQILSG